jgi:selenocysteine lyase/cysteine desulfurase
VRGGCFCNPGAAEAAFRFPAGETLGCLRRASVDGFTPRRFAECLSNEVPVGAIRVSVGAATSEADVDRCIDTLADLALCA